MQQRSISKLLRASTLVLASTIALGAAPAHASSTTLAELIRTGGSLTIGDKTFSDFQYEISGHFQNYTDALDMAGDIYVHTEVIAGNYGLDFVGTWGVDKGTSATAQLTYTVTVDPHADYYLSDFHLDGDLTVSGTNASGSASIRETVSDASHTNIPMTGAFDNPLLIQQVVPGFQIANDVAFTAPGVRPKFARIESLISLASHNDTTEVGLGHFQESFSQSPVPEPTSMALLLAGLLAVGVTLTGRQSQAGRRG